MVALRGQPGTLERDNDLLHGRCTHVIYIVEALLELILGATKRCLTLLLLLTVPTLERDNDPLHGRCTPVIYIVEALLQLILGTTKRCLTLLLLLTPLLNALLT